MLDCLPLLSGRTETISATSQPPTLCPPDGPARLAQAPVRGTLPLCEIASSSGLSADDIAICVAGGFLSILWFECLKVFKQDWVAET